MLLLNACQHLPNWFENQSPARVVQPTSKIEKLESHRFLLDPKQDMVGSLARLPVAQDESLPDLARHFGLGFNDISQANQHLNPWTPASGAEVLLPLQFILPKAPHQDIVLNLANMRMFYYPKSEANTLYTYPVGIGREGWSTPIGITKVISKTENPVWTPPPSIHKEHQEKGDKLPSVVPAGPENPLGLYAMRLAREGYLIHGTNKPYGIGLQVSHGCIQLYPEDIKDLFGKIRVGTQVTIVHQPYLLAVHEGQIYLEAHDPLEKWDRNKSELQKQLLKSAQKLAKQQKMQLDMDRLKEVMLRADGIPTPINVDSPELSQIKKAALELSHPITLFQQPKVPELGKNDWALVVAKFNNEQEARQLAMMLTHQGPIIPARHVQKEQKYYVIAGPFKNKKEMQAVAKRIKFDFELKPTPIEPEIQG